MPSTPPLVSDVAGRGQGPLRALPPSRRMGIWPAARKNHDVFHESKYSALATNVTRRRNTSGQEQRVAERDVVGRQDHGPVAGHVSRPSTSTRHSSRKMGLSRDFSTQ